MERKKKKIVLLSVYWSKEVSMMVKGSELPESSFWIQECINPKIRKQSQWQSQLQ